MVWFSKVGGTILPNGASGGMLVPLIYWVMPSKLAAYLSTVECTDFSIKEGNHVDLNFSCLTTNGLFIQSRNRACFKVMVKAFF